MRSVSWPAVTLVVFAAVCAGVSPAVAGRTLSDEILENRYSRGDYGVYLGWYDPWGAAFDVHATYALPVGAKVRLRLWRRLLGEMDLSYYRRGGQVTRSFLIAVRAPQFDGLVLAATLQARLLDGGPVRPYVGGGPVFVSLGNDFVVDLRACQGALIPECRRLVSWSESDVGLQIVAGADIVAGRRIYPFVEYRHLFGELTVSEIRDGFLPRQPDEIVLLDGAQVSSTYDWSGPNLMAGLKIRF